MALSSIIVYAAIAALASAAPQLLRGANLEEYDPNPTYDFSYSISDPLTGDSKTQHESRTGDTVSGQYSLIEPDGSRRTVDYTADPINGFNAVVSRGAAAIAAAPARAVIARPAIAVAPARAAVIARAPTVTYHL